VGGRAFGCPKTGGLAGGGEALRQEREAERETPVRPAVAAVVQLEMDDLLADARSPNGLVENGRAEVEAVLVASARVDPDRPRRAESVRPLPCESHRVPGEPPLPDLRHELPGARPERQVDTAVSAWRERRRRRVDVLQERVRAVREHWPPRPEVLPR